jgi:hypothetical protein
VVSGGDQHQSGHLLGDRVEQNRVALESVTRGRRRPAGSVAPSGNCRSPARAWRG